MSRDERQNAGAVVVDRLPSIVYKIKVLGFRTALRLSQSGLWYAGWLVGIIVDKRMIVFQWQREQE